MRVSPSYGLETSKIHPIANNLFVLLARPYC